MKRLSGWPMVDKGIDTFREMCQEKYDMTLYSHNEPGNIPLFFQLYLKLKQDIVQGEIEPGARVPNIEELHSQYGVSHATVRKALSLLESEGLITKKRGFGTIVRNEVDLTVWNPDSSLREALNAIKTMDIQPLSSGWVDPPRRILKIFQDQENVCRDNRIFCMRRLRVSSHQSWRRRVSDVFVPAYLVVEIGEDEIEKSYILEDQVKRRGYHALKIKQTLRPWLCDMEMARLLQLPEGTPVFQRQWIYRNPEDEVILVSESVSTSTALIREMEIATLEESPTHP